MIQHSRRRSWPDISSCNSTTNDNNNVTTSINDAHDSIESLTTWSLNSFKGNIPSSPSPNCSSFTSPSPNSPLSDFFYSQISPSVLSSPLHKRSRSSSPSIEEPDVQEQEQEEEEDDDEEDFQSIFTHKKDDEDVKEEVNLTNAPRLSFSTEYKSVFDVGMLPLQVPEDVEEEFEEEEIREKLKASSSSNKEEEYSKKRSSKEEEIMRRRSSAEETVIRRPCSKEEISKWPPVDAHQALMVRPKPYGAFLEEIKTREFEEKVDAWKEDQTIKIEDKLKKKENAIHTWELNQTKIATMRMKKIECKWERKRAKALKRLQEKIDYVQREAEHKKKKERSATFDELLRVSIAAEKMKATGSRKHLKFLCFF